MSRDVPSQCFWQRDGAYWSCALPLPPPRTNNIVHLVPRGGGIELAILAKHYGREIAAYNIETARGLVFGEEAGERSRRMRCS